MEDNVNLKKDVENNIEETINDIEESVDETEDAKKLQKGATRLHLEEVVEENKKKEKKKETHKLTWTEKLYKKLSKNYKDTKYFPYDNIEMQVENLQYNHIICCSPNGMMTPQGYVDVSSWIELSALLLYAIYKGVKDNSILTFAEEKKKQENSLHYLEKDTGSDKFLRILAEREIVQRDFTLDKLYGKYSSEKVIRAYKLYDTEYYIESTFTTEILFDTIVKSLATLDILNSVIRLKSSLTEDDFKNGVKVLEISKKIEYRTVDKIYKNSLNDIKKGRRIKDIYFFKGGELSNGCKQFIGKDNKEDNWMPFYEHVELPNDTDTVIISHIMYQLVKYIASRNFTSDALSRLNFRSKTRVTVGINISNGTNIPGTDIYAYSDGEYKGLCEFIFGIYDKASVPVKDDNGNIIMKVNKKGEKVPKTTVEYTMLRPGLLDILKEEGLRNDDIVIAYEINDKQQSEE